MPKDGLITGIHRASLHGSAKTVVNNVDAAERFVQTARELGIKTQKWSNLTNRHVHEVVREWQQESLKDSTIKGYMSGVRALARAWGNLKVAETDNKRFDIGNRIYVDNVDKSILPEPYEKAVTALRSGNDIEQRVGIVLELARHLGLRFEEAYKFDCQHSLIGGNTPETFTSLYITDGTKGGRDRNLHTITPQMREIVARHHDFTAGRGNLMMPGWKEKSVRQEFYKIAREHGISRKDSNGSFHAARHARAHEIFRETCGFEPPCRHASKEDFLAAARASRGDDYARLVNEAEVQVRTQFGHGAGRRDISAQYLGSWK